MARSVQEGVEKKMRVLVLGGSGFVGVHLIKDLMENDHQVTAVDWDRFTDEQLEFIGRDFDFRYCSFMWFMTREQRLRDEWNYDVVVPLQGLIGSKDSVEKPLGSLHSAGMNLMLIERLITLERMPLVVFVSSDLCYRKHSRCLYSLHKKVVEGYLRIFNEIYGLPYVVLRMATGYGPLQKRDSVVNYYVKRALNGETIPVYGSGVNRQAFIYASDAARCIRMACEDRLPRGAILPLVGENLSILELAEAVSEVVGRQIEHVDWPYLTEKVNVGDLPINLLPPKGWQPEVRIHEGIKRTVEWMEGK